MTNRSLVSYSFGTAWGLFKNNWRIMVGVALIIFALSATSASIERLLTEVGTSSLVVSLLSYLLGAWLALGMIRMFLDIFHGRKPTIGVLFSQAGLLLYFLGAVILYILMLLGGLVLFVIPGLFLAIKFYFFSIFIVDKELGPIESLKASWNLTKGHWWNVFGLMFLLVFFNLAGALALGLGLLVTVPVSWMAMICAYQFMSSSAEKTGPEQTERTQESLPESFSETQQSVQ